MAKKQAEPVDMHTMRHTCEHVMHQAVKELYPQIHLAMGPATDDGFYNDFDSSPEDAEQVKVSDEDFARIEQRMQELIDLDLPMIRQELSEEEARKLFADNPYKLEWIDGIVDKGQKITVYWSGEPGGENSMVDLCSGPHLDSTGQIGAFKLLSVAGAYWHGDEKNKMLTRIYGTCFNTQEELDDYVWRMEEAKKRDHRKIGQELDLFLIDDEVGKGLPLWMPKGAMVRKLLMDFALDTYLDRGYEPVASPHIGSKQLWETSGHWGFYRESMYQPFGIEDEQYLLKPMNCPFHVKIFKSRKHSYRDLPLRWTEMGTVYRYEKTGELAGLTRVRGFTQDDAHIICLPEQLDEELLKMINITKYIWGTLGLENFKVSLSVSDPDDKEKYLGERETWERAEAALEKALKHEKIEYQRYPGEAAFYGPKIDFIFWDSLGREWQLSTIQVDFNLPKRFDMTYVDSNGSEQRPIMLHRALLGSIERSLGILIEHYAGAFPVWLAPVQAMLVPIADRHIEYCEQVGERLRAAGIRYDIDRRSERMNQKIRDAQLQKVPYMLVVGDREQEADSVALRLRSEEDKGAVGVDEFIAKVRELVEQKSLEDWRDSW